MAINRYRAGRRVEYLVIEELRECGLQAVRTAGSHGPFDVIAWGSEWLYLIQVKLVQEQADCRRALDESEFAFAAAEVPVGGKVVPQTWIRCGGKFDVVNYPYYAPEGRT